MFLRDKIRSVHEKCAGDLYHQNRLVRRTAQMGKPFINLIDLFSVALLQRNYLLLLYQKHVNMILLPSVQLVSDPFLALYLRDLVRPCCQYLRLWLNFPNQNGETFSDLLSPMLHYGSLGLLLQLMSVYLL
jgi:hypothetical protein